MVRKISVVCPQCRSRDRLDVRDGDEWAVWQCSACGYMGRRPPDVPETRSEQFARLTQMWAEARKSAVADEVASMKHGDVARFTVALFGATNFTETDILARLLDGRDWR